MLLLLIYLGLVQCTTYENSLLLRTITALNRALEYMDYHIENINLDGVLGIRMADDQLQILLNQPVKKTYENMIPVISGLQLKAEHIANRGIPYIERSEPIYYRSIGNILTNGLWSLDYDNRKAKENQHDRKPLIDTHFNESISDKCLSEIIGRDQSDFCQCAIKDDCWVLMTSPHYSGYSLTHEVIYLQLSEICECQTDKLVQKYNQISIDFLFNYLCSKILKEAEITSENSTKQDLFMEQIGICGMSGFKDFYRPEWLEKILSWQNFNGCYRKIPRTSGLNKIKREEKKLKDGCLSHKTAVAIICLTVNIRFILTPFHSL